MNKRTESIRLKHLQDIYYEKLRGRIKQEYVFPALLFLRLYGSEIPVSEKNALVSALKVDAEKYDLLMMLDSDYHNRYLFQLLDSL